MLRPALPRIGQSLTPLSFRRSLQQVPILRNESAFKAGIPGLMSPMGFDIAWNKYQALMVEKLNLLTAGTEEATKKPKDILIKFARDPNSAALFNYASMAFNNHFFFNGLSKGTSSTTETNSDPNSPPTASAPAGPSPRFRKELEASFSSLESLRREFINTASAMFGPGFVWLVRADKNKFSILVTYLAGTPWAAAHHRRQPVDMNTEPGFGSAAVNANRLGAHGRAPNLAPGGVEVVPVLCLNTWEHAYLPDWGIDGKRAFAEAWWGAIDWKVAEDHAGLPPMQFK